MTAQQEKRTAIFQMIQRLGISILDDLSTPIPHRTLLQKRLFRRGKSPHRLRRELKKQAKISLENQKTNVMMRSITTAFSIATIMATPLPKYENWAYLSENGMIDEFKQKQ